MSHKKDARYRVNTSKRFYTFEPRYEKTFLFAAVSVLSLMFDYCLLQCYFFFSITSIVFLNFVFRWAFYGVRQYVSLSSVFTSFCACCVIMLVYLYSYLFLLALHL